MQHFTKLPKTQMSTDSLFTFSVVMIAVSAILVGFGYLVYKKCLARLYSLYRKDQETRLSWKTKDDRRENFMKEDLEAPDAYAAHGVFAVQPECKGCGAALDPMLTACGQCGRPHARLDPNTLPSEIVISTAARWIGLLEEMPVSGAMVRPGSSAWRGDSINKAEVNSEVKRCLTVLDLRSERDAAAKRKFFELALDYEKAKTNFKRRKSKLYVRSGLFSALYLLFVFLMIGIIIYFKDAS